MTIFGHLLEEGAGEERECADYPSLLNKIENDVIQWHNW
jgi:hypothetical protein